jgi:formamidopyrimidine-DNA glycosylase
MPELPEVETVRRALAPELEGARITTATVLDPRWLQRPAPAEFSATLHGTRVERVGRAGKYLIWELDGGAQLLLHLRMTGSLLYDAVAGQSYVRVHFDFDGGHTVDFVDPRRFGTGILLASRGERDVYLAERLGAEPMTPAFTVEYLQAAAKGRTTAIKSFLLDQRRIAGIGNIYADEALFRAGIHPLRPAGKLTAAQWAALKVAIEQALQAGIDAKGASIDDFRHPDGARGSFQDSFLVHSRAGQACPTCGSKIIKLVVGGRGTYVCEHCQPRPRPRKPVAHAATTTASRSGKMA